MRITGENPADMGRFWESVDPCLKPTIPLGDVIDPAEAIDALLAELHRQKAAGVRRVSVSEDSLKALKVMAGTAPAAVVPLAPSTSTGRPTSASPAAASTRPIHVQPASAPSAPVAPKITVNVAPAKALPAPPVLTLPPGTPAERLAWVHARIAECAVLREHLKAGEKPVVGHGSPKAKVLFVGEAPNMEEAEAGRVFVGDAGNLLRRILVAAALAEGAVIATEVDVTAVTETAVEVTVVPLESTTRAVMFCAPAEVGTHVIEYGAVVSTPMSVVPA